MVKAPHCVELAWKLPPSTCRYLVLTVCERSLLKSATLVPLAMHTVGRAGRGRGVRVADQEVSGREMTHCVPRTTET